MLVIITRTIIVLVLLVIVLRLMGKREIGQLQPFEFVITLIIAELACTPMQDISIPLSYGLVPLFSVFAIYFFITKISCKSIKFRSLVNGKPIIVVNDKGIDIDNLKKLNMHVNDLLQNLHQSEYFTIPQVKYAIVETNGTMSTMPQPDAYSPKSIPISLVIEGKFINENIEMAKVTAQDILDILKEKHVPIKDVVLYAIYDNKIFIQPKHKQYLILEAKDED